MVDREEAWLREVFRLKEELAKMKKDMKEIKAYLKELLHAGTF